MNLPSWLNIDPLAGVGRFLQGYGTGAQIGESLRHGEQRAAEQADASAKFSAELGQREASAQREYALHQQIQQEKAAVAARQLSGMQEFNALVAAGVPKDVALMKTAPNLFYHQPEKLTSALHQLSQEQQAAQNAERMGKVSEAQMQHWERMDKPKAESSKLFHVGNSLIRVAPDGSQQVVFTSNDPGKLDQWEHSELMAGLTAAKQLGIDSAEYKAAKGALDTFRKKFKSPSESPKETELFPMPKSKAELKAGKMYQTVRGPALWDGDSFVK